MLTASGVERLGPLVNCRQLGFEHRNPTLFANCTLPFSGKSSRMDVTTYLEPYTRAIMFSWSFRFRRYSLFIY